MPYDHLPSSCSPTAVAARALAIDGMLQAFARPPGRLEEAQRYAALLEQEADDLVHTLLKIVIEQGGGLRQETKAAYLLQTARHVSPQERNELARSSLASSRRHAQVALGLEYLTQEPAAFLAALEDSSRPGSAAFQQLESLLKKPFLARAEALRRFPAPAALAAYGALNAAGELFPPPPLMPPDKKAEPLLLSLATAWLHIGAALADPAAKPAALATPPWLAFLDEPETLPPADLPEE